MLVSVYPSLAQGITGVVRGDFQRFEVDQLGNIYAITTSNQLRKYNAKGDSVGVFNDLVRYGRLTSIDVSNPLRILLFYRDFGTIVLLDRMLKPLDAIDLRKRSMLQVTSAAMSYDNQCWIYDEQEARLRKIDPQAGILLESPDLRMIIDEPPVPVFMVDQDAVVTLYDPTKGFFQFDLYAAYRRMIPAPGWSNIRCQGNMVEGLKSGEIYQLNLLTGKIVRYKIRESMSNLRQLVLHRTGIYLLDASGIQFLERDILTPQ
jgi:hypothetical protein